MSTPLLLLQHRNGSLYVVVDTVAPLRSPSELAALAAQIGRQVPVFGLEDTVPTKSSVFGANLRMFVSAFSHDPHNMIALRMLLQWRGDFSPEVQHDGYVRAKIAHLVYSEKIRMLRVKIEPDVTVGDLVDYVRNKSVGDLVEFITEDECAAIELAGLAVPVAGNAADAAAAVCYAYKGELINALVSTVMILVPGFVQAGIVAVRRGKAFRAARAARRARALQRQEALDLYRRAGRRSVEARHEALRKLDRAGARLPVGKLPARGKRVGQGNFSEVYLSTDGSMVIKQIREKIGRPGSEIPISRAEQIAIAARTVEQHEILRRAGFPVPKSWVPDADPTVVVQQRAPGIPEGELPGDIATQARGSARGLKDASHRRYQVELDNRGPVADGMLFDEFGNVTAWYDPGIPLDSDATRAISSRVWAQGAL